jgi:hypothetical protein
MGAMEQKYNRLKKLLLENRVLDNPLDVDLMERLVRNFGHINKSELEQIITKNERIF